MLVEHCTSEGVGDLDLLRKQRNCVGGHAIVSE
jgi:hypothetical protein